MKSVTNSLKVKPVMTKVIGLSKDRKVKVTTLSSARASASPIKALTFTIPTSFTD